MKLRTLAIIPARKGSMKVKNKNIRPLNGNPLCMYTMLAAKQSNSIDRIIVSTNCSSAVSIDASVGI